MPVKFEDYYEVLGVARGASQADIQRAFRKLARKVHPDVNKDPNAPAQFKKINEAYEVLKDPDKRKKYDTLGANWKAGQDFTPPPGWENANFEFGRGGHGGFRASPGGFSDFFEMFFGRGGAGAGGASFEDVLSQMGAGRGAGPRAGQRAGARGGPLAGHDQEAQVAISMEEAYHGASRQITIQPGNGQHGQTRTLSVKIPPGVTHGSTIRLKGQGSPGGAGGPAGDLLLRVNIASHPHFELAQGHGKHDLITELRLSPWEAALGAKVPVHTLDGVVTLTVPPGTQSGQKLRLRNKGLPKRGAGQTAERGDLFARTSIVVPRNLTEKERELLEQLQTESKFDPRQ